MKVLPNFAGFKNFKPALLYAIGIGVLLSQLLYICFSFGSILRIDRSHEMLKSVRKRTLGEIFAASPTCARNEGMTFDDNIDENFDVNFIFTIILTKMLTIILTKILPIILTKKFTIIFTITLTIILFSQKF